MDKLDTAEECRAWIDKAEAMSPEEISTFMSDHPNVEVFEELIGAIKWLEGYYLAPSRADYINSCCR